MSYIHHGLMFSYYSAKTRAYLNYKRIPYSERYDARDLGSRLKATIGAVIIPIVETPQGEILQDTTVIIDELETRHPDRPLLPTDPVLLFYTRLVEFVIDEFWITTAMNARWNDPQSNAFVVRDFGYQIGGSMGLQGDARLSVGERVAGQMQSYLPRLGVADEAGQNLINRYFEAATLTLDKAVGRNQFAFGTTPSLIDVCLFTGYYAHQYRDRGKANDFMKSETPDLCYYLDSLHSGAGLPDSEEGQLTAAFVEYLKVLCPPAGEFASNLDLAVTELANGRAPGEFSQQIDVVTTTVLGEPFARGSSTFSAWKAQRVRDAWRNLSAGQQQDQSALVTELGWLDYLEREGARRLLRENYLTCLADVTG